MQATATAIASPASASRVRDYWELMKPGVMSLVVFSGAVGIWMAPGTLHPFLQLLILLCIAAGSGAGAAINMWYDRDIDGLMPRTLHRPIPAGRVTPEDALAFGCGLGIASVALLGLAAGWLAAGILAFAIFFYAVIYTMGLKRRTPQNIVFGGAAGAFPPVIGWAAAAGNLPLEPWLLFLIVFLWTPPHFWALALYRKGDYARAAVPMLPVVAGEAATRRQILFYTALLVFSTLLPWAVGMSGVFYLAGALALGAGFAWMMVSACRSREGKRYLKAFIFSIYYLFALLALMCVDRLAQGMFMHF